jgi:phosphatidylserine decarboxylase
MIRIHKEGIKPLFIVLLALVIINVGISYLTDLIWLENVILIASMILYMLVLQFFRNPVRHIQADPYQVIAPADGKIVVLDEVEEEEYFQGKRRQISIFMSPINVHVNRYPVGGKITYAKYHPGKFLVAWHPKSSTLNERTTVVVRGEKTGEILYRQIAGAMARRIIMYAKPNLIAKQGADSGFIRFGSRVDVFVPLDFKIEVDKEQTVKGGVTVLASVVPPHSN